MTQIIFRHIRADALRPNLAVILIAALALFATPPALAQADRGDIHNNRATFFVGGVYNAGSLTMKASSIRNNAEGTAELVDTSVCDNEAIDGTSGGDRSSLAGIT